MSIKELQSTIPLTKLMVIESWAEYISDDRADGSAGAFVCWVMQNQPDVVRMVGENTLKDIAEEIVHALAPEQDVG